MSRTALLNVVLATGSVLLVLVFGEVAVRVLVDFCADRPSSVQDIDWSTGISFLPHTTRTYESREFEFTVSFNRFGRRDVEWTDATLANPENVLLIGDSFVLGNAVEAEDTMASVLERRYAQTGREVEVLNFGMPAGAPPQYQRLLESALEFGVGARRVLIAVFVGNDFYPSVLKPLEPPPPERQARECKGWPSGSALVRFLKTRLGRSPRTVGWALSLSRFFGAAVYDSAGSWIFLREQTEAHQQTFQSVLAFLTESHRLCEAAGRELGIVLIPNKIQVENADALTNRVFDAARPNREILAWCEKEGVACLDLLPAIRAAHEAGSERLYFPIDRHFTPRGYALAAEAIFEFLEAQK